MSEWPSSLSSLYKLPSTNEPIKLYEGKMIVRNNLFAAEGQGEIFLHWNPQKRIVFEVATPLAHAGIYGNIVEVISEEWSIGVTGRLLYLEDSFSEDTVTTKFFGLLSPLIISYVTEVPRSNQVLFHLANFDSGGGADFITREDGRCWQGRHQLEGDEWSIILDSLDTRVPEKLEQQGGYCVTQIGRLKRRDGKTFSAETTQTVLEALSYFLSFTRGMWISPLLPFGLNESSQLTWREWRKPFKVSPWQSVNSSLQTAPFGPQQSFSRFLERWNDALWHGSIKRCVHWYVEGSLKAGGIEGSIILVAAAFELLAWTLFCEDPEHKHEKCADEQKFDKEVTAKTKLELLLRWAGASTKLPMQYTTLKQAAKQQAWNNNSAEIFLAVRNSLTHSAPQNRQTRASISPEALYEAYMLGMGYLKGFLQKLFNYPMPFVSVVQNNKR